MRKTIFKKGLIIALAVSMVFSVAGCGKKEVTREKQMMSEEDKDAIYTYENIEWDESVKDNIGSVQCAGDKFYTTMGYYNEETETYESYFLTLNMDGKEESRFVLPNSYDENGSHNVGQMVMTEAGDIYGVAYDYMSEDVNGVWTWNEFYSLVKFDNEGTELWEVSLGSNGQSQIDDGGEYFYVQRIIGDEAGNVWVFDTTTYSCYDKDGNQILKIDALENTTGEVWMTKDGDFILPQWNDTDGSVLWFKMSCKDGKISDEPLEIPGSYYQYSYYSGAGTEWDMLATNSIGVWAFNWGDAKMTKVMDFLLSDFEGNGAYNLRGIGNGQFIANYNDADWNYLTAVFTKVPKEDVVDKYIINLACYYIDTDVRRQIVAFNKSHDDVRITLTDYSSYNGDGDDWSLGMDTMKSDILSGNVPDILVVPNEFDLGMYANKGLFADMYEMIENDEDIELDDYLENIIALGEYNGELYELIPSFNAVTLIGKTSDVGEGFSWTFDDVNKLLEEKGEDVSLFSKDSISRSSVMYYGISMAFDQFYNSNTGECNFDSKEFIQFLELLKQFPETGPDVWMDDNYWMTYENQWRNGETILKQEWIYDFRNYVQNSQGCFGEEVSYIGFPTRDGSGSSAYVNFSLAIAQESAYKEEAWEFVSYFISDEYQENVSDGFPVKLSAIEEKAEKERTPNSWVDEETGEEIVEDFYFWIGDEEIILEMPTEEECEYVIQFLKSIDYRYKDISEITAIIEEDAAAFYEGEKTAEQVAETIQSRVKILISEQR